MKVIYVERMKTPYPTMGYYIIDSDEADTKMQSHLETGKLPDKCWKWQPILWLDKSQLQLTIGPNKNAHICDAESGKLIMVVLHNFVGQSGVLEWFYDIIEEEVRNRKNIRVCSPSYCLNPYLTFFP